MSDSAIPAVGVVPAIYELACLAWSVPDSAQPRHSIIAYLSTGQRKQRHSTVPAGMQLYRAVHSKRVAHTDSGTRTLGAES
eukprot:1945576-Rhodomonas_salina.9